MPLHEYHFPTFDWITQQIEGAEVPYPSTPPTRPTESARGRADQITNHVKMLVQQVQDLELRNAELVSEVNTVTTEKEDFRRALLELVKQRDEGWAVLEAKNNSVEDKIRRHIERYRRKRQNANNDGDLMAGAAADQRLRALEALLEN